MAKEHPTDYAVALEKSFAQWDYYHDHGGSDLLYTDGQNLHTIRRHILFQRKHLEENPTLFGLPEVYYREVPPEVDPNYMARSDEIRDAAKASLEVYLADPDYHFILAHREEIPPKAQEKLYISTVLGYADRLENAIADDNLVAMRLHQNAERYLNSFRSCAQNMQEYLADDEVFDEGFEEDFEEEPEQEFGGMTMEY